MIDLPVRTCLCTRQFLKQIYQVALQGGRVLRNWSDRVGKDFDYNVGFNFTRIKNNVDKFKGDEPSYYEARMLKEGLPIWSLYVREIDRIIQKMQTWHWLKRC